MKFKLNDLTPKTKFYVVDNGAVVAAKFMKAELELDNQFDFKGHRQLNCKLAGMLLLANGNTTDVCFTYAISSSSLLPRLDRIYATADDARQQKNGVEFEWSHYEFFMLMHDFGFTPTPIDIQEYGGGHTRNYTLWHFDRESNHFGAHLTPIRKVDLLNRSIVTDATDLANELFNTKEDCENANHVDVVEFADEPTEDEQPTDNEFDVHIVLIEVVK